MKIQIKTGVMIFGQPVFPTVTVGTGDKEKVVDTIIDLDKKEAKELVMRKQAIVCKDQGKAKVTFTLKKLESEAEAESLDAFFNEEE